MVRRNFPCPAFRIWLLIIAAAATLLSNPIIVPDYTPITEIQAMSQTKWSIEIDLDNIHFSRSKSVYSTDTLMLDCVSSSGSSPSISLKKCVIPEVVDTDNIVVLTESHFPSLQIQMGRVIYLGLKGHPPTWSAMIRQNLSSSGVSLKFMYTRDTNYVLSACPSLGIRNYSELRGRIEGTVRDKDNVPASGIRVSCKPDPTAHTEIITRTTNLPGYYSVDVLDSCHTYSLSFFSDTTSQIADTVIGPLSIKSGTNRILLDVVLHNYTVPPVSVHKRGLFSKADALVRLLPSDASARQIVVAVSGSSLAQKGQLDIYSMNGLHIRSLSFACTGSGTYTIPWDGCNKKNRQVPGGSYVCRVRIGDEVMCKGIITH